MTGKTLIIITRSCSTATDVAGTASYRECVTLICFITSAAIMIEHNINILTVIGWEFKPRGVECY